jgi:hypothetical protein
MAASRDKAPWLRLVRSEPEPAPPEALAYKNRRGDTYYLHGGTTKTGKPRYFVAKQLGPGALAAMPAGFTFTESINCVVSVSRITEGAQISPADLAIVQAELARCAHLRVYRASVVKGEIVVFQPDRIGSMEAIESPLSFFPESARRFLAESLERGHYSPVMKFVPDSGGYEVRRMTYRGKGGWSYPFASGPLASLARKFLPPIGTDAFYELY